ncbi:MAG: hypothetical protein ACHP84_01510 [Caulobacterales bacterium]
MKLFSHLAGGRAVLQQNRSWRVVSSGRPSRSLLHLQANASTSRTLSLLAVWKKHADDEEYKANPFFQNVVLNRSIIVKHRLRDNERDSVGDDRTSATKVILPIDLTNLGTGAHSFFVGQRGYENFLEDLSITVGDPDSRDEKLLRVLDSLPSLDPFLMRERLKKEGFTPPRCYFELSDADASRMLRFVRDELTPLIGMSFGSADGSINEKSDKLAAKLLANAGDAELDPLRQGMGMSKPDFEEGVFSWKGFIYYKWTLSDLLPKVRPVAAQITGVRAEGPVNDDERVYIASAQARLSKAIGRTCEAVRATLKIYDDAYADLTRHGQPQSFRQFLLNAPRLFAELGERLGSVQHVVSFWRFRFPEGARQKIGAEELVDLLADFEASLSFSASDSVA